MVPISPVVGVVVFVLVVILLNINGLGTHSLEPSRFPRTTRMMALDTKQRFDLGR